MYLWVQINGRLFGGIKLNRLFITFLGFNYDLPGAGFISLLASCLPGGYLVNLQRGTIGRKKFGVKIQSTNQPKIKYSCFVDWK
jgi:hypothetical protein